MKDSNKIAYTIIGIVVFIVVALIGLLIAVLILLFNQPAGLKATEHYTDEELIEKIQDYMLDTYDVETTFQLIEKTKDDKCIADIDLSCFGHIKNIDVYTYYLMGEDEDGREFFVKYTNEHKDRGAKKEASLEENYHVYVSSKKIEEIVKEYSDVYDVNVDLKLDGTKTNPYSYDLVIKIYIDKFNTQLIDKLHSKINGIDEKYRLIITNSKTSYQNINNDSIYNYFTKLTPVEYYDRGSYTKKKLTELPLNDNYKYIVSLSYYSNNKYKSYKLYRAEE